MIKFNDNDIFVGYLKQLLKSFNLPTIKAVKTGDIIYKNNYYIYENALVKATDNYLRADKSCFEEISDYGYGNELKNFTTHLPIKSLVYDYETHKYLGDYLRFQRDYNGLNLMSLYNCFTNETVNNVDFEYGNQIIVSSKTFQSNSDYRIYKVPVKFNQEYTIATSSSLPIEIMCGFYDGKLYKATTDNAIYIRSYKKINSIQWNKPVLYSKLANQFNQYYAEKEKDLCMFIKVPSSHNSSIVILEGNFTNYNNYILNKDGFKYNNRTRVNYKSDYKTYKYTYEQLGIQSGLASYLKPNTYYNLNINSASQVQVLKEAIVAQESSSYVGMHIDLNTLDISGTMQTGEMKITTANIPEKHLGVYKTSAVEGVSVASSTFYYSEEKIDDDNNIYKVVMDVFSNNNANLNTGFTLNLDFTPAFNNGTLVHEGNLDWMIPFLKLRIDEEESVDIVDYQDIPLFSKLQLLEVCSNSSYPFADRLMEYLVGNVIDKTDTIADNIRRVQQQLYNRKGVKAGSISDYKSNYGEWSDKYNFVIYDIANMNHLLDSKYDILGYIDKDTEHILGEEPDLYEE